MELPGDSLVERAADGDADAMAQLLERHAPALRAALQRKIPSRWRSVLSVDDVVQETYIDAFLDLPRFEPRGDDSFAAWLMTLAQRNLVDALRMLNAEKRGRSRRQVRMGTGPDSVAALQDRIAGLISTPSRVAARGEARQSLLQAVERLPDTYRTVVRMYDLEGQSAEDVAAHLDRSPGAVFMLRARAHRYIMDLLGGASRYLSGDG